MNKECQWIGCKEPAEIYVPRANTRLCEEHYLGNILRFGCDLKGEPIKKDDQHPCEVYDE